MLVVVEIREETAGDLNSIAAVETLAFGRADEADLVDRLRAAGAVTTSLVAEEAGVIAGHVLFSELPIETASGTIRAVALAPVAVVPALQDKGIGSALIREGLEKCRKLGAEAVVVLGAPAYYPRFGFSAELASLLKAPFSGPQFMALELRPGALSGAAGTVHYAAAFGLKGK
jgi:putative acetyltransferase